MRPDKIRKEVEKLESDKRFSHTLGVAVTAGNLACVHYEDSSETISFYDKEDADALSFMEKALIAGYLHDVTKGWSEKEHFDYCKKYDLPVTDNEKSAPALFHSLTGACYAKHHFGIHDEEILDAIREHTTGAPEMSLLSKIIFVADYIEPGRTKARDLFQIRKMAFVDIDRAVFMILRDTIQFLNDGCRHVGERSMDAYRYYLSLQQQEGVAELMAEDA